MHAVWCGVLQTDLNTSLCCNYKHGNTGAVSCASLGFKHQFLIIFHDHEHVLNDFIPRSETNDQNMWRVFEEGIS